MVIPLQNLTQQHVSSTESKTKKTNEPFEQEI
jgi:hypothetical protein